MLTLTRKTHQSVILYTTDGEITVTVEAIDGKQSKLSFDAPDSVEILREELARRKNSLGDSS